MWFFLFFKKKSKGKGFVVKILMWFLYVCMLAKNGESLLRKIRICFVIDHVNQSAALTFSSFCSIELIKRNYFYER